MSPPNDEASGQQREPDRANCPWIPPLLCNPSEQNPHFWLVKTEETLIMFPLEVHVPWGFISCLFCFSVCSAEIAANCFYWNINNSKWPTHATGNFEKANRGSHLTDIILGLRCISGFLNFENQREHFYNKWTGINNLEVKLTWK